MICIGGVFLMCMWWVLIIFLCLILVVLLMVWFCLFLWCVLKLMNSILMFVLICLVRFSYEKWKNSDSLIRNVNSSVNVLLVKFSECCIVLLIMLFSMFLGVCGSFMCSEYIWMVFRFMLEIRMSVKLIYVILVLICGMEVCGRCLFDISLC